MVSVPHPIFDAVFDAWWTERGVDPQWVRSMATGKVPTSRAFADAARVAYGIPVESWPKLEPQYPLTSDANSTTLQGVSAIGSAELAQGMSRSRSKKHPFVRALYEHPDPKRRMTVTEWAKRHGYKMPTVASWFARGPGARRIPMSAAEAIEKELGVPATLAVWKNGITTDR